MTENLYIKGNFKKGDENAVAIVGSRDMTSRGEKLAYEYSFALAKSGVTIVSGLARGIDSIAHKAALDAKGKTIAVMGTGLDIIYPAENKNLAEEIIKNGCLITQFKEGTPRIGRNFLARNKVVAELSKAIVVIEGKRRSGTLSTAAAGANLGKEVFAIPGSEATDWLIGEGATVANSPQDILDYLASIT